MRYRVFIGILCCFQTVVSFAQTKKKIAATFSDLQVSLLQNGQFQQISSGKFVTSASIVEAKGKGKLIFINYENGEGCTFPVSGYKKISMDTVKYTYNAPGIKSSLSKLLENYVHEPHKLVSSSTNKGGDYYNYPMLFPADNEVIAGQDVEFVWLKDSRILHEFVLEKGDDLAMPMVNLKDTSFCLNSAGCKQKLVLKEGLEYYWTIQDSHGDKDSIYLLGFKLATLKDIQEVIINIAKLDAEKTTLDPELYCCLKAAIYEDHKMFSEARKLYMYYLNMSPRSSYVKDAYDKFILRVAGNNQKTL